MLCRINKQEVVQAGSEQREKKVTILQSESDRPLELFDRRHCKCSQFGNISKKTGCNDILKRYECA